MLVGRCSVSHGAAVSEIGVVLAPLEVMACLLKVKAWKSAPLAGNGIFGGGSNGICTLRGCIAIRTLGGYMGICGNGGVATDRPRRARCGACKGILS